MEEREEVEGREGREGRERNGKKDGPKAQTRRIRGNVLVERKGEIIGQDNEKGG
jgi:hypothetical protein